MRSLGRGSGATEKCCGLGRTVAPPLPKKECPVFRRNDGRGSRRIRAPNGLMVISCDCPNSLAGYWLSRACRLPNTKTLAPATNCQMAGLFIGDQRGAAIRARHEA